MLQICIYRLVELKQFEQYEPYLFRKGTTENKIWVFKNRNIVILNNPSL